MKKLFLSIVLIAVAAFSANAQFFIGGSLGIDGGNNKIKDTKIKDTNFGLVFSPEIGYKIADKHIVGLRVDLNPTSNASYSDVNPDGTKASTFNWNVSPYYRYNFCKFNKFGIWGQVYGTIGSTSRTYSGVESKATQLNYGLGVCPVLSYDFNEHLGLVGTLEFLTLGWNGTTSKQGEITSVSNKFSFGFNKDSYLKLGIVYSF